jgi:hypothetical protein
MRPARVAERLPCRLALDSLRGQALDDGRRDAERAACGIQNRVDSATRTPKGEPGVMLLLLCANA